MTFRYAFDAIVTNTGGVVTDRSMTGQLKRNGVVVPGVQVVVLDNLTYLPLTGTYTDVSGNFLFKDVPLSSAQHLVMARTASDNQCATQDNLSRQVAGIALDFVSGSGGSGLPIPVMGGRALYIQDGKIKALESNVIVTPTDPHWNSVTSLLNFNGTYGSTTFTDEKGLVWEKIGNTSNTAELDTNSPKFGTACLWLASSGAIKTSAVPASAFSFGAGNFTIEFFFKPFAAASAITCFFEHWNTYGIYINATADGRVYAGASNSTVGTKSVTEAVASWTPGGWQHLAFVRNGTDLLLFKEGVLLGTASGFTGAIDVVNESPVIGYDSSNVRHFTGHIDSFRVTKGVARYTANFTPPTEQFPTS